MLTNKCVKIITIISLLGWENPEKPARETLICNTINA